MMTSLDLYTLMPEVALSIFALVALMFGAFFGKDRVAGPVLWLSVIALLAAAVAIGWGEQVQELLGRNGMAGFAQDRDGRHRAGFQRGGIGGRGKVDADAHGQQGHVAPLPRAFQQDARDLAAVQQDIVRPLDRKPRGGTADGRQRLVQRKGRDKAVKGHVGRRALRTQRQGGGEVARRHGPGPATATASRVLPMRHDPDGPCQRRAETDRLGIRAVGLLKDQAAHALRPGRRRRQAGLSQRVQSRRRPGPG